MTDPAQVRHDELAEINLRILVKLYDVGPIGLPVLSRGFLRPGAHFTGASDVDEAIDHLTKSGWIRNSAIEVSIVEDDTEIDERGRPVEVELDPEVRMGLERNAPSRRTWLALARAIMAKSDRGAPIEQEATMLWQNLSDYLQ